MSRTRVAVVTAQFSDRTTASRFGYHLRVRLAGTTIPPIAIQGRLSVLKRQPYRCNRPVSSLRLPLRTSISSLASLYVQAQKTCDNYYHDHHTDYVKDVHCHAPVERCHALRMANLRLSHPGWSCHGCQNAIERTLRSSTNAKSV